MRDHARPQSLPPVVPRVKLGHAAMPAARYVRIQGSMQDRFDFVMGHRIAWQRTGSPQQ
jgi:hypothetical protein